MVYCRPVGRKARERDGRGATALPFEACPHCGRRHAAVLHGAYRRGLVSVRRGMVSSGKVTVPRSRCKACGKTDALLPFGLVGGSVLDVGAWVAVAEACRRANGATREVAEAFRRSVASLGRALRAAEDVVAELRISLEELAEGIAQGSRDSCALAASYARRHGTTPFSRLRLSLVEDGGRGASPDT